jgi:hypothetical protein
MDSEHSTTGRSIRRISGLVATAVLTLGMVALTPVPAGAATSPPHAPVGLWLSSSDLTAGQFCSSVRPLSRTATPILGSSKGTPAHNANRPNLMATYEVATVGQVPLVTGTVGFNIGGARFQVPAGILGEGDYLFRARAVDGGQVSAWLPWCAFSVQTTNVPTPAAPRSLRLSASAYEGFQFCGPTTTPVASTAVGPTFAATPGTYSYPANPNLTGRFEIARPGLESVIVAGNMNGVSAPPGSLPAGTYQFRVRAEEGNAVSAWSSWCTFVVQGT